MMTTTTTPTPNHPTHDDEDDMMDAVSSKHVLESSNDESSDDDDDEGSKTSTPAAAAAAAAAAATTMPRRPRRHLWGVTLSRRLPWWKSIGLHVACLLVYALPMFFLPNAEHQGRAVLDEMHVQSNVDISAPVLNWTSVFTNDYWGRPMDSPSSHKSWRPLTVLSFRFLKAPPPYELSMHRWVNLLAHAAVAEQVSLLALQLFPTTSNNIRWWTKLCFMLHPTHVEAVANAANRPHVLAVLCSTFLADPKVPLGLFGIVTLAGFLVSETFLFQVGASMITLWVLVYVQTYHGTQQVRRRGTWMQQVGTILSQTKWRLLVLMGTSIGYCTMRWQWDWLSIPDGLIRPAENPYYELQGWERLTNYAYITSIHVAKAWDWDFIGFSHEYGRACLRPMQDRDVRLIIPVAIAMAYAGVGMYLLYKQRRQTVLSVPLLLYVVHLSWMSSLFPISGIVKVGTFVADRIVVASTVSTSMMTAYAATLWLEQRPQRFYRVMAIVLILLFQWRKVHHRTLEWMDPKPLLESALWTCPRFAKGHLEVSKIYSGLYPELLNFTKSRWHLQQVEEIDPSFCDVHHQFALIAFQETNLLEFEERLTKSMLCPFTMGFALNMWKQYWPIVMNPKSSTPQQLQAITERFEKYQAIINRAVAEEAAKDEQVKSTSPLIGWKREL